MNKIVHLGLFLAIVSAVAGGALAFANQMTAPVIAANNEKQEKESLLAMYPDANSNDFKLVNKTLDSKTVQKVYDYKNVYIFNMKVSGYKDGTVFLVSIDKDSKKIDKYNAISNGDTKGLGSQVTEAPFKKSRIVCACLALIGLAISFYAASSIQKVDTIPETAAVVETMEVTL